MPIASLRKDGKTEERGVTLAVCPPVRADVRRVSRAAVAQWCARVAMAVRRLGSPWHSTRRRPSPHLHTSFTSLLQLAFAAESSHGRARPARQDAHPGRLLRHRAHHRQGKLRRRQTSQTSNHQDWGPNLSLFALTVYMSGCARQGCVNRRRWKSAIFRTFPVNFPTFTCCFVIGRFNRVGSRHAAKRKCCYFRAELVCEFSFLIFAFASRFSAEGKETRGRWRNVPTFIITFGFFFLGICCEFHYRNLWLFRTKCPALSLLFIYMRYRLCFGPKSSPIFVRSAFVRCRFPHQFE